MFGGSALAWLIMIPAINIWGGDSVVYPATDPMSSLESGQIWSYYLRYVGGGRGVGCAGIVTLIKSFPTIVESIRLGVGQVGGGGGGRSVAHSARPAHEARDGARGADGGGAVALAGSTGGAFWGRS